MIRELMKSNSTLTTLDLEGEGRRYEWPENIDRKIEKHNIQVMKSEKKGQ